MNSRLLISIADLELAASKIQAATTQPATKTPNVIIFYRDAERKENIYSFKNDIVKLP